MSITTMTMEIGRYQGVRVIFTCPSDTSTCTITTNPNDTSATWGNPYIWYSHNDQNKVYSKYTRSKAWRWFDTFRLALDKNYIIPKLEIVGAQLNTRILQMVSFVHQYKEKRKRYLMTLRAT